MLVLRTILHPTDFSAPSRQAFAVACSLARHHNAKIIVMHVLERPVMVYTGVMMAPPPPPPSEEERQAAREQLLKIAAADPKIALEHRQVEGDPAAAILEVAQNEQCDMIVMGTHGRTGLERLIMGSVAEKVMRNARCPVLTMRTLPPDQPA